MTGRVLSARALNRALLARQHLLEPATTDPVRMLERVCGLQTQYAPAGYLGLRARLAGFRRAELTDALLGGRVLQGWVMRSTIHMVAAGDHRPFCVAVRAPRREQWLRVEKRAAGVDMAAVAACVRDLLAAGPRPQREIQAHLAGAGYPPVAWAGVQLWLDLVRVPPAGTWERPRAHVYGLAPRRGPDPDPDAARARLVSRYLRAFGPASVRDVASFCGLGVGAARAALDGIALRRFRDEAGGELLDLPRAPLPDPRLPAPVRFLGQWDAVLLAHARRADVLPQAHRSRVFATSMPQSVPTFLVDGRVAGSWTHRDGRVETTPFRDLTGPERSAVADEAGRLAAWYASG